MGSAHDPVVEFLIQCARHGVTRAQVMESIAGPAYARAHRRGWTVIGGTADRVIVVVLRPHGSRPGVQAVVTARVANRWEKRLLERRGRLHR